MEDLLYITPEIKKESIRLIQNALKEVNENPLKVKIAE
jgi:hypothetical protein